MKSNLAEAIGSVAELQDEWLANADVVGVTAGASTPEDVVLEVVDRLCREGAALQHEMFVDERVSFRLPREVAHPARPTTSLAPPRTSIDQG